MQQNKLTSEFNPHQDTKTPSAMKRRLDETDVKHEASAGSATGAALSDDMKLMVAKLVAKELLQSLLPPAGGAGGGAATRFGNVSWETTEEQNVNAFLHQKLGKNHLTRRPGPGGTRLTYIESCKAIELANLAFGFNGWSCRVLECKEEYVRTLCGQCDSLLCIACRH